MGQGRVRLDRSRLPRPVATFVEHYHPDTWELCLYTAGHGVATVGGRDVAFTLGTLLTMPPRVADRERSDEGFTNIFMHVRDWAPPLGGIPVVCGE